RDFVALQYDLDARLVGGAPPDVIRTSALPFDAEVATVANVGDCEALYWKERWWTALERSSGERFHRLTGVAGTGRVTVVKGPNWKISLTRSGGHVRFSYLR